MIKLFFFTLRPMGASDALQAAAVAQRVRSHAAAGAGATGADRSSQASGPIIMCISRKNSTRTLSVLRRSGEDICEEARSIPVFFWSLKRRASARNDAGVALACCGPVLATRGTLAAAPRLGLEARSRPRSSGDRATAF